MNNYLYYRITLLLFGFSILTVFFASCSKEETYDDIAQCIEYDGKEDTYVQKEEYKEGIFINTYCALGASTASMQWQKDVAEAVSEDYKSYSIPGCRWAYAPNSSNNVSVMADELASLLKDKNENGYYPDLITIMCGINDASGGFLGNCSDADPIYNGNISVDQWLSSSEYKPLRESVYGSIVFMMENLKINFPKSCILIMTTQQINNSNFDANKLIWINRIIKSVAKSYSIPVIDVFNDSGINFSNIGVFLDDTRLHPNVEGEKLLQNYVEKQVRLKYTSYK